MTFDMCDLMFRVVTPSKWYGGVPCAKKKTIYHMFANRATHDPFCVVHGHKATGPAYNKLLA